MLFCKLISPKSETEGINSNMAAAKYRKLIFPYYEYNFTEAVSDAVTACNLNFILRKEQMQALYEYTSGRNVVNLQTGYGKSICYSLCPF
jgi:superfamily II DNA or RNA helicase